MTQIRSWLKDNATLATFLVAQAAAMAFGIVSVIIYAVKLETRVAIMETRGAEYTVTRLNKIDERLTMLEGTIHTNSDTLKRVVDIMTRELNKQQGRQSP